MEHTVSIVIPNWNGRELLCKNMPAVLLAARHLGAHLREVMVVNDGSTDGSLELLRTQFPSVTVYDLPDNVGFHRATNYGFEHAKGSIVILLNTDIEPEPDAFETLVVHFNDPLLFGASGRIYDETKTTFLYGNRGGYFRYGHFTLFEKNEHDTTSQSLFVCGGAGAFSREKFLALGGFDTLFSPFYYEEQDVSYRALKRGWHIVYEPASKMYHQIRSTISKTTVAPWIRYISARNNYLFVLKNMTDLRYTLAMILFVPLWLVRDAVRLKFRFWIALLWAIPRIPRALVSRLREQRQYVVSDREVLRQVHQ